MDGIDEVFLSSLSLQAVLRPDKDASLIELSSYPLAQNFADSLKRYEEHYHAKAKAGDTSSHAGDGIASAHDVVRFKHEIKPEDLQPDKRSRGWFAETWTDFDGKLPVEYSSTVVQGGAVLCMGQAGEGKDAVRIAKIYSVQDNRVVVALKVVGKGRLSTRLNIAMPCCDGPAGRYLVNGEIPGGFGQSFNWSELKQLTLEDHFLGAAIKLETNRPARIKAQPHFTVSQSEAGFEKIMQAVELTLTWQAEDVTEVQVRVDFASLR